MDEPMYKGKPHGNILKVVNGDSLSKARGEHIVNKANTLGWGVPQETLDIITEGEDLVDLEELTLEEISDRFMQELGL